MRFIIVTIQFLFQALENAQCLQSADLSKESVAILYR